MKKYILFDLDGTITDPKEGITKAVAYALNKFGIKVDNLNGLCKFIGPPLKDSFMEYYNFSDDDAEKAIEYYREYFADRGIYENQVYEGFEDIKLYDDSDKDLDVQMNEILERRRQEAEMESQLEETSFDVEDAD